MNKALLWGSITVFGFIGSYIPTLWGDSSMFSPVSIIGGLLGSFFGIWVALRINDYVGGQ
jgi:hypothetical protein